jgi:hypothetical protein
MKKNLDDWGALIQIICAVLFVGGFVATAKTHATREEVVKIAEEIVDKNAANKVDVAVVLEKMNNMQIKISELANNQQTLIADLAASQKKYFEYLLSIRQLPE